MSFISIKSHPFCAFLAVTIAAFSGLFLLSGFSMVSPRVITRNNMLGICVRIDIYAKSHFKPPASLDDLPERVGYLDSSADGWGRVIGYSYDREKRLVELTSLGRDGKKGGTGDDEDFIVDAVVNEWGKILQADAIGYMRVETGHDDAGAPVPFDNTLAYTIMDLRKHPRGPMPPAPAAFRN